MKYKYKKFLVPDFRYEFRSWIFFLKKCLTLDTSFVAESSSWKSVPIQVVRSSQKCILKILPTRIGIFKQSNFKFTAYKIHMWYDEVIFGIILNLPPNNYIHIFKIFLDIHRVNLWLFFFFKLQLYLNLLIFLK